MPLALSMLLAAALAQAPQIDEALLETSLGALSAPRARAAGWSTSKSWASSLSIS